MKIEQVTNLKRQATKILEELHRDKEAILITEHGQPSAYLVDVEDYQMLQRRLSLLDGLAKGERDIQTGNIRTHAEAREKLNKWLK